jgi:hypothetical protein
MPASSVAIALALRKNRSLGKTFWFTDKEKKTALVIRTFICTTTGNRNPIPTATPVVQPTPQENTQQLVGAGVATASNNGHSRNTNISHIPF